MQTELENIWSRVQSELGASVSEPTYRIWLEPLQAIELAGERLVVAAPWRTRDWVGDRFGRVLQACVAAVLGPQVEVHLVAGEELRDRRRDCDQEAGPSTSPTGPTGARRDRRTGGQPPAGRPGADRARSQLPGQARPRLPSGHQSGEPALNPKLTFEQFVIGDSNRLAHAAALAVAEMPSQAYNPLFIYGPPGLGKTHLLHSIATYVAAHGGGLTTRYTTGEAFTTEFVAALGTGSLDHFKARFRHVDVLLIDDVQFLERKTRTEEEFFHTFNTLWEIGSQVVVTCDRMPRDLAALEDRLRERFESGLVADIRPPDLPTRLTILRKRTHQDSITVEEPDALQVIAERVANNIRALEGALIRVVAYASLTGRPLTTRLACDVVDNLYPAPTVGPRSVLDIKAATCEYFSISLEELVSHSRVARIAWARQVAIYLTRELTEESLLAIGRHFGGRDHSTVLHACRRASERIDRDPRARTAVDTVRERVRAACS